MNRALGCLLFLLGAAASAACKQPQKEQPPAADSAPPDPNLQDCDDDPATPSADTRVDAQNCGKCKRVCTPGHGKAVCAEGKCAPACEAGWAACGKPEEGCTSAITNNPHACGNCETKCEGGACVDKACLAVTILAKEVESGDILFSDAASLYMNASGGQWSRIDVADGKVETTKVEKLGAPLAISGTDMFYNWRVLKELGDGKSEVELLRRKGPGPTGVAGKMSSPWSHPLVLQGSRAYYARHAKTEGTTVFTDLVAFDWKKREEIVIAANEKGVRDIVIDGEDIYWVAMGAEEVRTAKATGGDAKTLASVRVPTSIAVHGKSLLVAGMDGLSRVPMAGGAAEIILSGRPKELPLDTVLVGVSSVAVVGDDVFWTIRGSDGKHVNVLRTKLPK